jgi:small acid-soluble spore protein P (minor)
MSKPKTQPVGLSYSNGEQREHKERVNEPLAGSKKVKNRNHSRQNHGEGS